MRDIDSVYQALKRSRKYKYLCEETLCRIAGWATARFEGKKAVDAARRKLHQVYGSYFEKAAVEKLSKWLNRINVEAEPEELKSIALSIMDAHVSTAERLPFLEEFYRDLFERIGRPRCIVDLACGLNPLAVQWMRLAPDTAYYAYDIDMQLIALLNRFFGYLGMPYRADCADILVTLPRMEADTVLLLKTLSCLEQQEKGISEKLIRSLNARHIVVSFPSRTMSGKGKGLDKYYDIFALNLLNRLGSDYFRLEYPSEIFYVIRS